MPCGVIAWVADSVTATIAAGVGTYLLVATGATPAPGATPSPKAEGGSAVVPVVVAVTVVVLLVCVAGAVFVVRQRRRRVSADVGLGHRSSSIGGGEAFRQLD